ncbi:hypothetical protein BVC80_9097g48 [Macleaya cordata]|uniref:Transmembrane protein n=1 Tax=Macleaya cordata TaxID=56857 RepID=A0A200QEZ1_MACCD|nr:hypothetical protein BVC80_9097g48 [Macleaya cordata]
MGRFYFLRIFVVLALVFSLSFSQGSGRELKSSGNGDSATVAVEKDSENGRVMMEVMDYEDPGPNPRSRRWLSPPPPVSSLSPPAKV